MKKIVSIFILIFSFIFPAFTNAAIIFWQENVVQNESTDTDFPEWEKFTRLKDIIDKYLVKNQNYYSSKYQGNLMYNEIIEKEIKAIIIETYSGNEQFYKNLFWDKYLSRNWTATIKDVLKSIPKTHISYEIKDLLFRNGTAWDRLMNASFWVDYNNNVSDSLLSSLKRIIDNYKRRNSYYPTIEELWKESVYNNWKSVLVSEIIDDFIYEIGYKSKDPSVVDKKILDILSKIDGESEDSQEKILEWEFIRMNKELVEKIKKDLVTLKEDSEKGNSLEKTNSFLSEYEELYKLYNKPSLNARPDYERREFIISIKQLISFLGTRESTYTLKRKKSTYTYEEALEKNEEALEKLDWSKQVNYKDYKKLIWNQEVKNIPEIYKKIPNDSIFLHVKNPKFIFDLVNKNNSLLESTTWLGVMKRLKTLTQDRFDIEDFSVIEKNLKHEFLVVISDLDITNPDIVIIINKEDKAILVPTDKPKVAVTKGDYIYIANSKKSLEKFDNLTEENSIYNSLDFKYLWLQRWNKFKDVFFFAGDKFFEKMISFDNFINMRRKVYNYIDLKDLQDYIFAYKKLNWKDVELSDLDNFFSVTQIDKQEVIDNYEILSNSILKNKKIWTIDDVKWLLETDYDLSKISSEELMAYQQSILKYKEVWRANLDPMWVFINSLDDWFSIDFFMTPMPELDDNDFDLLKVLFGKWIKEFDLLKNEKLRIGTIWWMVGLDFKKIKEMFDNTDENSDNRDLNYIKRDIDDFNNELLDDWNIFDYLWWELMFSFWWIDPSILNRWDADKLDAFIAVEFTSKIKAKEFISILRKKIADEMGGGYGRVEDSLSSALMKPISEEYNWNTIYIIPFKDFFFPITFYYTIFDNFVYVTISKWSVKSIIDYSVVGWDDKQKFVDKWLDGEKMFYWFMDADKLNPIIKDFASGTWSTQEDLYVEAITNRDINILNPLTLELSKYYRDAEYDKVSWRKLVKYENDMWFLNIFSSDWELYIKIDKSHLKGLDPDVRDEIDNLLSEIWEEYFWEKWGKLVGILNKDDLFEKLLKVDLFNKVINSDFLEKLILNTSFDLNFWDNMIEFSFASFGKNFEEAGKKDEDGIWKKIVDIFSSDGEDGGNNFLIFGGLILFVIIVLGGVFVARRKKKED